MRNRKKDRSEIKVEALREKNRRLREALKALKEERKEQYIPVGSRVADGYGIDWSSRAGEKREPANGDKGLGVFQSLFTVLAVMMTIFAAVLIIWVLTNIYLDHRREESYKALIAKERPLVTAYYPDLKTAGRKGGVLGEWVPMFVPDGATEINEKHDAKTGEGWLSFRFPLDQGKVMSARIYRLSPEKVELIVVRGTDEKWWPQWLKGKQNNPRISSVREFYRTNRWFHETRLLEYMAIDWDKHEAYLWRELI